MLYIHTYRSFEESRRKSHDLGPFLKQQEGATAPLCADLLRRVGLK